MSVARGEIFQGSMGSVCSWGQENSKIGASQASISCAEYSNWFVSSD